MNKLAIFLYTTFSIGYFNAKLLCTFYYYYVYIHYFQFYFMLFRHPLWVNIWELVNDLTDRYRRTWTLISYRSWSQNRNSCDVDEVAHLNKWYNLRTHFFNFLVRAWLRLSLPPVTCPVFSFLFLFFFIVPKEKKGNKDYQQTKVVKE